MAFQSRLEIIVDSSRAQGSLKRLEGDLNRTQAAGEKAFSGLQKGAMAFGAAFAAIGAGTAFKNTISTIMDFQSEMSGLQAVARASVEDLARLEQQARLLGATTAYGANQAAQAQKFLAQGGLELNQILGATPQVMRLAQAGMLGLGEAADLATDVMAAMSLQISDIGRIGDVLVATSQAATTDVQGLGQALSYSAGQGADFNLTLEETVAALGMISSTGAKGSRAGTGLVGVIAQLSNVSGPAKDILDEANVSLADLNVEARGLVPVLETLAAANLSAGERQKIFGLEAAGAAGALLNGLPAYKEQIAALQEVEGLAEEAANTMTDNLGGAFKGLSSAVAESNLQLGDSGLSATLEGLIKTGTGVVQIFNGMGDEWAASTKDGERFLSTAQSLVDTLEVLAIVAGARLTTALIFAAAAQGQKLIATQASLAAEAATASAVARRTAAEALAEKRLLGRAIAEAKATQGTAAHTAALAALNVQRARSIQASTANTLAVNAEAAAMGRASVAARAMGAASRGAAGAMALMGGPLGLLIGAGGLLIAYREELGLVRSAAEPTTQRIDNLTDALNRNSVAAVEAGIVNLSAEYFTLGQRAAAATAEIERLTAAQENDRQGAQARLQNNMRLRDLREELAQVTTEQEAAGKAATQLRETLAGLGETVVPTTNSLTDLDDTTLSLTDSIDKAADKTYTLADAYESLLDRITPNRREARQYAQDLGTLNLALASGRMTAQQYMQAMGMLQDSFQAAQRDTGDLSDKVDAESDRMATLWERRLERMDDAGVDMWRSFLDGSEDAFGSFRRLALDTLAEVIHAYTTQRITASLGLNVADGGASGGGLSFNGIGSLINGGKSLLGIGSSAAAPSLAMQGGLSSAALASASQVAGGAAYSGWAGSAASGAALGNVASGGIMSSITAGVSAAMPWIAGGLAIDSLLGGGITKAISGLFGGGKTNPHLIVDTRASNNYGHGSVREGAFGAVGFGQGTRRSNDLFGGIDKEREFLAAVAASDDLLASLARSPAELNRMAEAVQGVRLSASGVDGIMAQLSSRTVAAVSALDGEFGEFVGSLGTDVDTIIARTQSAVAAMNLMGAASENLNLQFDASASGALRAADSIAQIAGGVEQLATLQDSYYQAFFSDAERAANLQRELTQELAKMGYALPSTREGFRALVEQQNQLTESGQRNYVQLLQLAGAFDQMQTMLANAGSGVDTFADQLSRLNDEIGSLENDVRQAYQAFERQAFDQQAQLLGMMGDEQAALALQRERELLSIDPLLHETQRFIWAMEDEAAAKERVTQAAQNYRQEIERVRDQLGTALGGINQWIDQRNATGQTPGLNLEAAGEQFARQLVLAESGDRNALQSITQYADQYLAAGEAMFASGGAFQSIQQDVLSALQSLPEQISSEEYLAKEIRAALQDAVNSLPGGIADALHPMFDSIDLDASGLIDWNEFYGAFRGLATDEELRRIFRQLDKDGSGTISRLEALNRSSEGTEGNTQTLEERARDQLSELGGLVSEMTRTTDQFVGLNSGISSLSDSINALGVTQAEVARIEKERAAAEKAERVRLDRERQVGELEASYSAALKEADYRMERRSFFMDATRDHAGSVSDDVEARVLNYIHENTSRADMTADERDQMHRWMTRVFGENSPEYLYALSRMGSFRNEALAREAQRQADTLAQQLAQISSQQSINGSHATGLWNVPFDNYIAELHRDEMVVPAETAGRLRELPNRELPMPTLPNFPLLNRNDQHDVVRDLLNENKTLRKELTALLKRIEQHGAAGVAVQQEAAKQQIRELKKSNLALDDMSAAARLEASR